MGKKKSKAKKLALKAIQETAELDEIMHAALKEKDIYDKQQAVLAEEIELKRKTEEYKKMFEARWRAESTKAIVPQLNYSKSAAEDNYSFGIFSRG